MPMRPPIAPRKILRTPNYLPTKNKVCTSSYKYLGFSTSYGHQPRRSFTNSRLFSMKEAIVAKGPKVTIHDVDIPKPNTDQVLIKVVFSGSNPKDWKRPNYGEPHNSGDDIAGIVEEVGENVVEFKKGDRVAAFHEMMSPHGSFAEYAIAWAYTTFHLPKTTSFEEVREIQVLVVYILMSTGGFNTSSSNDCCSWALPPFEVARAVARNHREASSCCLWWI